MSGQHVPSPNQHFGTDSGADDKAGVSLTAARPGGAVFRASMGSASVRSPGASAKLPFQVPAEDRTWYFPLFFQEYPLLRAFRHGVMLVMPLLLVAALALLVNNFPVQVYQDFMLSTFGESWKQPGQILYNGTIEVLALATSFSLSDCLVNLHNKDHPGDTILPSIGAITAFSCLFIMMGPNMGPEGILLPWAGIRGLFASLVITFCACSLLLRLCRVKRLKVPFYSEGADPILPNMFDTLLPVVCTLVFFTLLREALFIMGVESLHKAFYDAIRSPFQDAQDSLGLVALYTFLVQFCWFFGIHGADLLDPITHHVLAKSVEINSWAINQYLVPPHIFTKHFFDVYLYMGGSGSTLGLLAAIFLRSRDNGTRRVAGISILPGIFNINELLIFGLPIVLNPAFLIPFILTPLVLLLISYAAVSMGIAPLPVYQVDWTTPPLISAFISTNSWRGVAMQIVNLTVATLIYLPFVTLADKAKLADRRRSFAELAQIAESNTRGVTGKCCTDRPGRAGALARSLANDLLRSLEKNEGGIQLYYQPRVDLVNKTIPCVEALLRWEHPAYGSIPTALILAIAEDSELSYRLDNKIVDMAFEQQRRWREEGITTTVSINLSEGQLQDPHFPILLKELFRRNNLPPGTVLLEIRESLVLDPHARYLSAIETLHATGANIAVDHFGNSYQAIAHAKRLPLSEVQIDRSLIEKVVSDKDIQEIICTIQEMCYSLGIKTTAEHVETAEQLETLLELNFSTFQGHYFLHPVSAEECGNFLRDVASKAENSFFQSFSE